VVSSEASLGFFAEAYRDEITLKAGLIWLQVLGLGELHSVDRAQQW
jgi:hypothetical protein